MALTSQLASPAFDASRSRQEDLAHAVARIERLGKHLFGVSACVVHLHVNGTSAFHSAAHRFCAELPLSSDLQVVPEKSSPFQPALGQVDQLEVRFYALQPLRASDGQIVGSLGLIHERPRMFTDGDRQCLQDLIAVLERELHHHAQASSPSV